MASYNRIIMIGNLTKDPEKKQLPSGQTVCRFSLASNRQFKNRQSGDMVQEVCYIDVDVWGPQADSCNQYLSKGKPALIEGRLKFDTWQDNEGHTKSKHSIVAERVLFLNSNSQDTQEKEFSDDETLEKLEPRNKVERELMSQLDSIKQRIQEPNTKTIKSNTKTNTNEFMASPKTQSFDTEFTFKDTPPFQDDLPF